MLLLPHHSTISSCPVFIPRPGLDIVVRLKGAFRINCTLRILGYSGVVPLKVRQRADSNCWQP
ncbi:hypothetical protein K503DRAFT_239505 [Rhizopogon vinicolor AM-OR11-026]|uniref:Uncharacterized protein n=1 Tax=Rhizopogon vinicolor AM-OR11-026 TaxID=1314800 RepID=A0A1B7MXM7_9AGAM|nr:hypothetical protein K503DRAFT_239505 [Rhizopogon vinicolor AM-OR11-026]